MNISVLNTGPFKINTLVVPLCANKVFVVDPAACTFTNDENKITNFLSSNNLEPVAFLLTHGHFDHIAGTGILKKMYPNVPLICHKNDSIMIGQNALWQKQTLALMGLENLCCVLENLPNADILFSEEPTLDLLLKNSVEPKLLQTLSEWKVLYTPGHTQGSVCYYNQKEKVLLSGDTIFFQSWGRTDLPGGNESLIIKSLNKIYSKLPDNVLVYPGHEYYGFYLGENK